MRTTSQVSAELAAATHALAAARNLVTELTLELAAIRGGAGGSRSLELLPPPPYSGPPRPPLPPLLPAAKRASNAAASLTLTPFGRGRVMSYPSNGRAPQPLPADSLPAAPADGTDVDARDVRLSNFLSAPPASVVWVVVVWRTGRGPDVELPGVFRTRSRALALAQKLATEEEEAREAHRASLPHDDSDNDFEEPERFSCHRHGATRLPSESDDSGARDRWDVVPVSCDPPLAPRFDGSAPNAASAAQCAGNFQALARAWLLCSARLAAATGARLPKAVVARILDDVASSVPHATRARVVITTNWAWPGAASPRFAVPTASAKGCEAAAKMVAAWAKDPNTGLAVASGSSGWTERFPSAPDEPGFDAKARCPRRAAHATPPGFSRNATLAELEDDLNYRTYTKDHGTHGLVDTPVDVVVSKRVARSTARFDREPTRRSALCPAITEQWDGVDVARLCPVYDLLSPMEAALSCEETCGLCGVSCEATTSLSGPRGAARQRIAHCLACRAERPLPGATDVPPPGWAVSHDPSYAAYELCLDPHQPFWVTKCATPRCRENAVVPAKEAKASPRSTFSCVMCTRRGGVLPKDYDSRFPKPAPPSTQPTGVAAARPKGWSAPLSAKALLTLAAVALPADLRQPAAHGALPGWEPSGRRNHNDKQLWIGDCGECGSECEVPFMPRKGKEPPLCHSCLYGEEEDNGYGY